MKRIICMLTCVGLLAVAADEGKKKSPEGQAERGGNRPRPNVEQMIANLDKEHKEILKAYGANDQGQLTAEQKAAMEKDLDMAELQKKMRRARVLRQFKAIDTNGDGVLSEAEIEAAKKKWAERRGPRRDGEMKGPRKDAPKR